MQAHFRCSFQLRETKEANKGCWMSQLGSYGADPLTFEGGGVGGKIWYVHPPPPPIKECS